MPRRLTLRPTLALIATAFCLGLAVQAFAGGSSTPKTVVVANAGTPAEQPGPEADLKLTAVLRVPALRNPIKPKPKPKRKAKRKSKREPRTVSTPAPVAMSPLATPAPTATPQYVPTPVPTPRYIPPRRTPAPTPKPPPPTPEPSGDFDTSGGT